MGLDRRTVLAYSCCVLAAGLAPVRSALAAEIKSLVLVQPFGKLSMAEMAYDLIRPVLQQALGSSVSVQTIVGRDGFNAINAVVAYSPGEPKVVASAIMGPQYLERMVPQDVRIESLTPIAKLTNGYSVTLFTRRGGPLKTWSDLAAVKPLKVSSLERGTAAFVAKLMMERKGGITVEATTHDTIPTIVDDVVSGRCDAGVVSTSFPAARLDLLRPIVSFGAARNAMLGQTPTFAEVTGNPKLAFTESIGAFASPRVEPSVAALLSKAFISAGQDLDVIDGAEAKGLPLAISGPEVLVETIARNKRVLERILG